MSPLLIATINAEMAALSSAGFDGLTGVLSTGLGVVSTPRPAGEPDVSGFVAATGGAACAVSVCTGVGAGPAGAFACGRFTRNTTAAATATTPISEPTSIPRPPFFAGRAAPPTCVSVGAVITAAGMMLVASPLSPIPCVIVRGSHPLNVSAGSN